MNMRFVMHPCIDPNEKVKCIYIIKFATGRFYIGATKDLYQRIRMHLSDFDKGRLNGTKHNVLRMGGIIRFEILKKADYVYELAEMEALYFKKYRGKKGFMNKSERRYCPRFEKIIK